jgi:RimJ/RimL family protein N-acetyltransferase
MFIKYKNVKIRNAVSYDASLLGGWLRDERVMAYEGFGKGFDITDEQVKTQLSYEYDAFRRLILELDNVPIGYMSYFIVDDNSATIGINIADQNKQNKGYGTLAIKMLISHLFTKMNVTKIHLHTQKLNKRARHVYENIGFRITGGAQGVIDYEITKTEYESLKTNEI